MLSRSLLITPQAASHFVFRLPLPLLIRLQLFWYSPGFHFRFRFRRCRFSPLFSPATFDYAYAIAILIISGFSLSFHAFAICCAFMLATLIIIAATERYAIDFHFAYFALRFATIFAMPPFSSPLHWFHCWYAAPFSWHTPKADTGCSCCFRHS